MFVLSGAEAVVNTLGLSCCLKGTAQAETVGAAAPRGAISYVVGIGLVSRCLNKPVPRASQVSRARVVPVALSSSLSSLCRCDSHEPSS